MSDLSIFVDESGDFGKYSPYNPYYLFTLVLHEQSFSISECLNDFEGKINAIGLEREHCFHAGPIIRKENDYKLLSLTERRKYLNMLVALAKKLPIKYHSVCVRKEYDGDKIRLNMFLSKRLAEFIRSHYEYFLGFSRIVVYYDNGQTELASVLVSVMSTLLDNVEFRIVKPSEYRLFQVSDLLCSLELCRLHYDDNVVPESQEIFFGNRRYFLKNYWKSILKLRFD